MIKSVSDVNCAEYNARFSPAEWDRVPRHVPSAGARSDWETAVRHAERNAFDSSSERRDLFLEGVLIEDLSCTAPESLRQRRHAQFRELAELLAVTLTHTKLAHLAPKVLACHTVFRGWQCDECGSPPYAEPVGSCSVRICPFEMRARAMRALHRFRPAIGSLKEGKYLVLAERNAPLGGLGESLQQLFAAFGHLRKMPEWKNVRGAIVVLEVTFNRSTLEEGGSQLPWHPHLNVLFDGPYIPFEELLIAWQQATRGRGRTAYIRQVDRGTSCELLKYITKLLDFIDIPVAVEEFLLATRRRRFVRTYGSLYRLRLDEETAETQSLGTGGVCPDCRSEKIRLVASCLFLSQVHFDAKGVFRVNAHAIPLRNAADAGTTTARSP